MKIRTGFVSNSSSSSFVIARRSLSNDQVEQIQNHSALGKEMGMDWADDAWSINVNDNEVTGWTTMTNFDMQEFFQRIGIPDGAATWEDDS